MQYFGDFLHNCYFFMCIYLYSIRKERGYMMFISQTIHCTSHDSSYSLLSLNTASGLKIISDLIFVSMTKAKM